MFKKLIKLMIPMLVGIAIIVRPQITKASIWVSPSSAASKDYIPIYVHGTSSATYVRYTVHPEFPADTSIFFHVPQENTQNFQSAGIWYLHVFDANTGEARNFGPYTREFASPNKPTISLSSSKIWNTSATTVSLYDNGDNASTGRDDVLGEESTYASGVKNLQWKYSTDSNWNIIPFGGMWAYGTTKQYSDGKYTIQAKVVDNFGNESDIVTKDFNIDKTAPSGSNTPAFNNNWSKDNMIISFTPTDNLSGVQKWRYAVTNDYGDTWSSWSSYYYGDSPTNITLSEEGVNHLKYEVVDNAGNTGNVDGGYYSIDKTAPTGTFSPNSKSWTNSNISVKFSPVDNLGAERNSGVDTWKYAIYSNGAWSDWSQDYYSWSTPDITLSQEGFNQIKCKVIDGAGNARTVYSGGYYIDKTPPIITGIPDVQYCEKNVSLSLSGTDATSGMASITLTDNDKNTIVASGLSTLDYVVSENGIHHFTVKATDKAGNVTTKDFTIRKIRPLSIISLTSTRRAIFVGNVMDERIDGPLANPLEIFTGVDSEMETKVCGANIVEVEFYNGVAPINGITFSSQNAELVQYDGTLTKYEADKIKSGDNPNDNKITMRVQNPDSINTANFKFNLPTSVPKGSIISIKVTAYNTEKNLINNVLGNRFLTIKGDIKKDISINNIR